MKDVADLVASLYAKCHKGNFGNIFVPGRLQEIVMSSLLGHTISTTLSGADGYDERGECEYKTTTGKNIKGTYKGISIEDTWGKQQAYITKKLGDMNHYIGRFDNGLLVEVWKLDGQKVLDILMPRLYKQYHSTKHRKDPRPAVTLCKRDIYKYGERVL